MTGRARASARGLGLGLGVGLGVIMWLWVVISLIGTPFTSGGPNSPLKWGQGSI